jgi:SPP1 gp7 family putative phage head morphogenesis protein
VKTLPRQELRHTDYAELLKRVDVLLWEIVYGPLVDLVRPTLPKIVRTELAPRDLRRATPEELRNAADDEGAAALKKALASGVVQMVQDPTGKSAQFAVVKPDRRISDGLKSFGCKLNKVTGFWYCAPAQVPAWVRLEASGYAAKAAQTHDDAKRLLDDLEGKVDSAVDAFSLKKATEHATGEIEDGWKTSARALQVVPNLGARGQEELIRLFDAKARIPIKNWAKEAIARLREQVDDNAMQGYRSAGLASRIRDEYAVSKGRADLIARQETNNFMSAYRAARALDAGLKRYVWAIADRSARTRPGHKEINGRTFTYEKKAPAIYMSCGVPCNPGSDFRCRCNDLTVVE